MSLSLKKHSWRRRVLAKLKLWPDPRLMSSSHRKWLSHEKLMEIESELRRSIASSTTGVVVNSAISAGCQLFAFPAAINLWQTVVGAINLHKVKKEIKKRIAASPGLQAIFGENRSWGHRLRDIGIGIFLKLCLTTLATGLSSFEDIADAFVVNFSHSNVNSYLDHISQAFNHLKAAHPQMDHFDQFFHHANAGFADEAAHNFNRFLLPDGSPPLAMEASHHDLSQLHHGGGVSTARIALEAGAMAAAYEFVQPVVIAGEHAAEKAAKVRFKGLKKIFKRH